MPFLLVQVLPPKQKAPKPGSNMVLETLLTLSNPAVSRCLILLPAVDNISPASGGAKGRG